MWRPVLKAVAVAAALSGTHIYECVAVKMDISCGAVAGLRLDTWLSARRLLICNGFSFSPCCHVPMLFPLRCKSINYFTKHSIRYLFSHSEY